MLDKKKPREQSGRDSFARYKAQVRSAAMATLSILEDEEIDRVYCDLHDDFVVRKRDGNGLTYLFYQVKTKGKLNHNWKLSEVFGLNTRKKNQDKNVIKDSFVGKLLLHTVVFDGYCNTVVFQTNIHNGDDVTALLQDIESGEFASRFSNVLIDNFNGCYASELNNTELSKDKIKANLAKLTFETDVQYLKDNDDSFEPLAREKIYKYSEVDLERAELKEILLKLLDLVERKSSGVIPELTASSIEELAGISIEDLLKVLSISKEAYQILRTGGDSKAIKSASIIQRALTKAGASTTEVEYCSRCKTQWDVWIRNNRHVLAELDLNSITQEVKSVFANSIGTSHMVKIKDLRKPIRKLIQDLKEDELIFDLNEELILGGIFSEFVKGRS